MKEEEYLKLGESVVFGIKVDSIKSLKRGRSLLVGFYRKRDLKDPGTIVHHVYVEDEIVHSLVYAAEEDYHLIHDTFTDSVGYADMFRSNIPFLYVPEFCDFEFSRRCMEVVPSEKFPLRKWRDVSSERKGPYRAKLMHELKLTVDTLN